MRLRWHDPTYYVSKVPLIFYMMRIRAFHLQSKKKGMSPFYFYQNLALKQQHTDNFSKKMAIY